MSKLEELIKCIKKFSADAAASILDAVYMLLASDNTQEILACPCCSDAGVIRFGHKCGRQRFLCKQCGRTFVTTTIP